MLQTLATLIHMCKPDKTWEERVEGAETLAYLIEVDVKLQYLASISDHIISTLAEYFKYPGSPPDVTLMPTTKVRSVCRFINLGHHQMTFMSTTKVSLFIVLVYTRFTTRCHSHVCC